MRELISQYRLAERRDFTVHVYSPLKRLRFPTDQSVFVQGCPWDDTPVALHQPALPKGKQLPSTFANEKSTMVAASQPSVRPKWEYEFVRTRGMTTPAPTAIWPMRLMWSQLRTKGDGIRVAVLDTGYDSTHHLLQSPRVSGVFSSIPDSHAMFDSSGHGTAVAGIIAQLAPKATLIIGKVMSSSGLTDHRCLSAGIKEAVRREADIISISWGTKHNSEGLFDAVHSALAVGVIIICAASNMGRGARDTITYPAAYGSTICVGGHDEHGHPERFSPTGREIDFLAPAYATRTAAPPDQWRAFSGTSAAAPFVAALSALLLASDRKLQHGTSETEKGLIKNVSHIRSLIREVCTRPGDHSSESGYGVIAPMPVLRYGVDHLFLTPDRGCDCESVK